VITRNNPDVGYLDESTFALLGFSQVVRADSKSPSSPTPINSWKSPQLQWT
jgi:hypothetical protein